MTDQHLAQEIHNAVQGTTLPEQRKQAAFAEIQQRHGETRNHRKPAKGLLIAAAAVISLLLMIAAAKLFQLDDAFWLVMKQGETNPHLYERYAYDVNVSDTNPSGTLTVSQVINDDDQIWLSLMATAPDGTNLQENLSLFAPEAEVNGIPVRSWVMGSASYRPDLADNQSASFVQLRLDREEVTLNENDIVTLRFSPIRAEDEDTLLSGTWEVSFPLKKTVAAKEYPVDATVLLESFRNTPIHIHSLSLTHIGATIVLDGRGLTPTEDMTGREQQDAEILRNMLSGSGTAVSSVTYRDGTVVNFEYPSTNEVRLPDGNIQVNFDFDRLIDIDQVVSVKVYGETFMLTD